MPVQTIHLNDLLKHLQEWKFFSTFLKKIESENEYEKKLQMIADLMDEVGEEENHPLSSMLELLAIRVEEYEKEKYPMDIRYTPVEMLKRLMEEFDLKQGDLKEIGSQGVVSEILNGKRKLNEKHIEKLAERFGVTLRTFYVGI